jgi:hypothetical protein
MDSHAAEPEIHLVQADEENITCEASARPVRPSRPARPVENSDGISVASCYLRRRLPRYFHSRFSIQGRPVSRNKHKLVVTC